MSTQTDQIKTIYEQLSAPKKNLLAAEKSYFKQIMDQYDPEDVEEVSPTEIAALLKAFWDSSDIRKPNDPPHLRLLTLSAGSKLQALMIHQNDVPFIVESVMGELIDNHVKLRAMFHPVVSVSRGLDGKRVEASHTTHSLRESMMLVIFQHDGLDHAQSLIVGLEKTLNDLTSAVADFPLMQALLEVEINTLEKLRSTNQLKIDPVKLDEDIAFLRWIDANNFVFLGAKGYVYPLDAKGVYQAEAPLSQLQEGYGVLRDTTRPVLRDSHEPAVLSASLINQIITSTPVTVAKANLKSLVHRRVHMDYIGIKRYGSDGMPTGEIRFVGLFTADAYNSSVFDVPSIRQKAQAVLSDAFDNGAPKGGYIEKKLINILETYSRDELFQINTDDLIRITKGVLRLTNIPKIKLFTRKDAFDRFISVLLYLPREAYSEELRQKAGNILAQAFKGRFSSSYPNLSEGLLSSVHYIIGVNPRDYHQSDLGLIEEAIEAVLQDWSKLYLDELFSQEAKQGKLNRKIDWMAWSKAFSPAYQERYGFVEALNDTQRLSALSQTRPLDVFAYVPKGAPQDVFHFKLYSLVSNALALSDLLPILEHSGLKTLENYSYGLNQINKTDFVVQEFVVRHRDMVTSPLTDLLKGFEELLKAVLAHKTESDGLNSLVLLGLDVRDIALLRTLVRYRMQSGLDASFEMHQAALSENGKVTKQLVELFVAKFRPSDLPMTRRKPLIDSLEQQIIQDLQQVRSLDHDRVIRRLLSLIMACLRTNYFQTDAKGEPKTYISIKIDTRVLVDLPQPKPYREIFVWAPHVEGVHLRFGPVARGGLRWSDRRDDFRTEVLGLVKAQQVKNAVIVPVGSKGGFYPKKLPHKGTPDETRQAGILAYKTFLYGLLDLTDNISSDNSVISPKQVVLWDEADPYLVVAADKGTASFSDIANGVAADYGFWLDDAFASGGSKGYDHKAMGITAKGAWEAVKRHFREMGKNIQTEDFTVAGIGDMSGDVFGNGMLLSQHIRLVAAFDHRDIFLDPNPDVATSFKERARLFSLARSSWADYDASKISHGGGVFSRSVKSIPISPEVARSLGIEAGDLSPQELMKAILKAPVELLYFGGIGTYIKAPSQTHNDVGDKASDAIRIDANEVRAKVIGEGANLGITQKGRIALSQAGVRLNTDAIDNSAGVDCSDHEVNLKILLGSEVAQGRLDGEKRDALLLKMTDEVSRLVLQDNYDQTLALSLLEANSVDECLAHDRFMNELTKKGSLNRLVEDLPSSQTLIDRQTNKQGLTRPELAVLLAYAKLDVFDTLIKSDVPDDISLEPLLVDYFPQDIRVMQGALKTHRLKREIITTQLANQIVNMTGPSFVSRAVTSVGTDTQTIVKAFIATRDIFDIDALWARLHGFDNLLDTDIVSGLYSAVQSFIRHQTYLLARKFALMPTPIAEMIVPYKVSVAHFMNTGHKALTPQAQIAFKEDCQKLITQNVPEEVASSIALLKTMHHITDVIDLSTQFKTDLLATDELHSLAGECFGFNGLAQGAAGLSSTDPWDRLAARRLFEDVRAEQKTLTGAMLSDLKPKQKPADLIADWQERYRDLLTPLQELLASFEQAQGSGLSFAKLTIANARLREWITRVELRKT